MNIRSVSIAFFVTIPILTSCEKEKHAVSNPTGNWTCALSLPNIQGRESIRMSADSSLVINDRICYSSISKHLKFSVLAEITNNGQWLVRNDSLILTLDKTHVVVDSSSFSLTILQPDSSKNIDDSILAQMNREFCAAVSEELKTAYDTGDGKVLNLGRLVLATSDSLVLNNGSAVTTFQSEPDADQTGTGARIPSK